MDGNGGPMQKLSENELRDYRRDVFRLSPQHRVQSQDDALAFVNARGFVYFWPIQGVDLPSLWCAVAGDRPVASNHDDPGHITWRWKDKLLGKGVWYYAKVLRGKATLISMQVAPYFYALSENFGAPEEDYLLQYEQGRMRLETKSVYEALLREGPLDTISLRRAAHLSSRESDYRFGRALTDLQTDFKIVPVGVAEVGAWGYAFVYDALHRHLPQLLEEARWIGERDAQVELVRRYLLSVGAFRLRDVVKLFRWPRDAAQAALDRLLEEGEMVRARRGENQKGAWLALSKLCD
jgi:hypothetical protein